MPTFCYFKNCPKTAKIDAKRSKNDEKLDLASMRAFRDFSGRDFVDLACHFHVSLGYAPGVVRGQLQGHLVVDDVDVGMMTGSLGRVGNLVYELHRFDEIFEFVLTLDGDSARRPAGKRSECGLSFSVSQGFAHSSPYRLFMIANKRDAGSLDQLD